MLKIFAKLGTNKKILICCKREDVHIVQGKLNKKYPGDWIWVDNINQNELLKFNDSKVYRGFDGVTDRYCGNIEKIGINLF
ncbi:MAG: hypothetical protein JXB17_12825 [Bacteroidales bacterium]|nr:hypothetical protein [Bacteroidales bacterium]